MKPETRKNLFMIGIIMLLMSVIILLISIVFHKVGVVAKDCAILALASILWMVICRPKK
ncbi:MAG: hypothetical protein IKS24_00455 [Bacteroidaceae bacterium]|jgi:hypothetical protein|nr:hypothetical protein [Bacteroidaceae bacterium]